MMTEEKEEQCIGTHAPRSWRMASGKAQNFSRMHQHSARCRARREKNGAAGRRRFFPHGRGCSSFLKDSEGRGTAGMHASELFIAFEDSRALAL
jgi:hypothetical protein